MGTGSIKKLMLQLMIPAVVAQVVNLLYNIVDRIYIGHIAGIGAAALTGVGLFTPILMLLNAFAMLVGAGGAPRMSNAAYAALDKRMDAYGTFLRNDVAKAADPETIIGDPIGRDAVEAALHYELIPYTPEEIVRLAERELAWCQEEMRKAAAEIGVKALAHHTDASFALFRTLQTAGLARGLPTTLLVDRDGKFADRPSDDRGGGASERRGEDGQILPAVRRGLARKVRQPDR